jgi:hypothetical protein
MMELGKEGNGVSGMCALTFSSRPCAHILLPGLPCAHTLVTLCAQIILPRQPDARTVVTLCAHALTHLLSCTHAAHTHILMCACFCLHAHICSVVRACLCPGKLRACIFCVKVSCVRACISQCQPCARIYLSLCTHVSVQPNARCAD